MTGFSTKIAIRAPLLIAMGAMFALAAPAMADDAQKFQGDYEFASYCASCHGEDGAGEGPMAGMLTPKPTDLTQLSASNGGAFPYEAVFAMIEGRTAADAHGRDMPTWGARYRLDNPEPIVRARVLELVFYIRTLQK